MALAEWLGRMGDNFSSNFDAAGPQGLAQLGAAIAGAPRNQWGAGLAQGLADFGETARGNKKKAGLAEALKGMVGDFDPRQKMLVENYPELALPHLAKSAFEPKETTSAGPFTSRGFQGSAANILVQGQMNPQLRASPEYAVAYYEMYGEKPVMTPTGYQMYSPPIPPNILPPTGSAPQRPTAAPGRQPPPPGPQAPPPQMPPPPMGNAPGSAGFEPDDHPELYPSFAPTDAPLSGDAPMGQPTFSPIPGITGNRSLTPRHESEFQSLGDRLSQVSRATAGFKDEYGSLGVLGAGGDWATWLGRTMPGVPGAASSEATSWWGEYNRYKNVVRNELFGSALTATEQAAFEKADVNEDMDPKVIRANLKIQRDIIDGSIKRRRNAAAAQGYNRQAIDELTGINDLPAASGGSSKRIRYDASGNRVQ